jgi:WD40 repeat protein
MTPARFQPGGTLREDAFYIEREADRELFAALAEGESCAVLAPRQIGKSSLRVRTARRLRELGLRVATVDLTRIGGRHSDVPGWYFGLVQELGLRLGLDDAAEFWTRHEHATPLRRFVIYLQERVLGEAFGPVVVFFDEIDSVVALPFSVDDFFAALRDTYNARAEDRAYFRLAICLMGVASPGDLARDARGTPFNVGRAIRLEDFTHDEARGLLPGLEALGAGTGEADRWLSAVYSWTSGHPYMMQKVCVELSHDASRDVDAAVARAFLRHGRGEDPNLEYAERRLTADPRAAPMLRLYRRLLDGERVVVEREDLDQRALRLTGMAAEDRSASPAILRVRNRIYATVFDAAWVREKETTRLLTEPLARWLVSDEHDDFVLRGHALDEAQAWARGRADLLPEESRFLLAGLEVARREEALRQSSLRDAERRAAAERAARSLRRSIAALSSLVVLLVSSLAVSVWEYRAARRAQHRAEAATRRERGTMARALAAQVGQEIAALHAGVEAVAPSLVLGERPPESSLSGLTAALFAADYSRRVDLPAGSLNATDVSADGRRVVVALNDRMLRAWEAPARASPPLVLEAALRLGQAPQFTRSGGAVVAVADEGVLREWSAADGRLEREEQPVDDATPVDAAPLADGSLRVLAVHAQTLTVVDAGRGPVRSPFRAPVAFKLAVLSPDGRRVAVVQTDHDVAVLDVAKGAMVARLIGTGEEPRGCRFSADGGRVVSAVGGTALAWTLPRGTSSGQPILLEPDRFPESDETNVDLHDAALSDDGRRLVVSGRGAVVLWDFEARRVLERFTAPFAVSVAISPDGRWIAAGRRDGRVSMFEATPSGRSWSFRAHSRMLLAVRFAPDGKSVVTASVDRTVRVFSTEPVTPEAIAATEVAPIAGIGLSPDGGRVVHCGGEGELMVRDARDGRLLFRLIGHMGRVERCRFSPNGKRIVTGGADRTVRHWRADTGELVGTIAAPAVPADVVFSPDGRRIAASFIEGPVTIRVWDAESGTVFGEVPVPSRLPGTVRFSADGLRVLAGGPDGNVAVLEPSTGRTERMLNNGATTANIVVTPDGGRILTTCADATAHVWDARTGEELLVFRGRSPEERAVRFMPDGSAIHFRGVLSPVPATAEGLLRAACTVLSREHELDPVREHCRPYVGGGGFRSR